MFATISKGSKMSTLLNARPATFTNNTKHMSNIRTNNKLTFQSSKQFSFQRSFASGRAAPATSTPTSFTTSSSSSPSLFLNNNRDEEILNQRNRNYFSNSWMMALAAAFGLTAVSLLSADEKKETSSNSSSSSSSSSSIPALSPEEWRSLTLSEVHTINHNTKLFRFKFDDESQVAGLTVASCLVVRVYNEETKDFDVRPYTPVSSPETKGYLDLIVKKYDNGKVTPKIFDLKIGEKLDFQGPWTKIEYKPNMKKEIGMIAGGTGITPMLQVLKEVLKNKEDKTKISLIFANITEGDILLKNELDSLASKYDNFKVYYTLDRPSENWKQGKGFVSEQMIRENFFAPSDDKMIFVCGPDPMVNFLAGPKGPNYTQGDLTGLLSKLGYTKDQVYKF